MKSIRARLAVGITLLFLVVTGSGLSSVYFVLRHEAAKDFDDALRARVQSLASMAESEHGGVHFDFPAGMKSSGVGDRVSFRYRDASGSVLAESSPPPAVEGDLSVSGDLARPDIRDIRLPDGRLARVASCVFNPAKSGRAGTAGKSSALSLLVVADRHELDETLSRLLLVVSLTGGVMLVAVLALVPYALARGLRPLDNLGRRVGEMDAAVLARRFTTEGLPEELCVIVARLNELFSRLESSFARERRFSADISHELRTPVAELKSLAECARRWPDMRTEQNCDDMLGVIGDMEKLISSMLALAACENGILPVRDEPFDLGGMIRDAVPAFDGRAAERGLSLRIDAASATVRGDSVLIKAVLTNLLDNAVSYAPERTWVEVLAVTDETGWRLLVSNPAPDLSPDDVGKLFDGFWRKDKARTGSHAGLGLTLARSFARAMGMSLEVQLARSGVLSFTLLHPVAPVSPPQDNHARLA